MVFSKQFECRHLRFLFYFLINERNDIWNESYISELRVCNHSFTSFLMNVRIFEAVKLSIQLSYLVSFVKLVSLNRVTLHCVSR